MKANNGKLMRPLMLQAFNDKYSVVYDAESRKIIVSLKKWNRSTAHPANAPFHINSRKSPKRKVVFNMDIIDIFIDCQTNPKTQHITIFDIHDAAIKLKIMYQPVTTANVIELCIKGFDGIKRI